MWYAANANHSCAPLKEVAPTEKYPYNTALMLKIERLVAREKLRIKTEQDQDNCEKDKVIEQPPIKQEPATEEQMEQVEQQSWQIKKEPPTDEEVRSWLSLEPDDFKMLKRDLKELWGIRKQAAGRRNFFHRNSLARSVHLFET